MSVLWIVLIATVCVTLPAPLVPPSSAADVFPGSHARLASYCTASTRQLPTHSRRREERAPPAERLSSRRTHTLASCDDDARVPSWRSPMSRLSIDSVSIPLRTMSHEVSELEFHISPASSSSRPQTSGDGGHQIEHAPRDVRSLGHALWALDRLGDVRDDSVAPAAHLVAEDPEASRPRLPTAPSATTPRCRRCRRGPAPARSRSGPPARAPRAQSGRGRRAAAAGAARPPPRRRARSAAPSGRPRRAGASRGRSQPRAFGGTADMFAWPVAMSAVSCNRNACGGCGLYLRLPPMKAALAARAAGSSPGAERTVMPAAAAIAETVASSSSVAQAGAPESEGRATARRKSS